METCTPGFEGSQVREDLGALPQPAESGLTCPGSVINETKKVPGGL